MNSTALGRAIRRAESRERDTADPCALCGVPVEDEHGHVLDERDGALLCACRACSLLFGEGSGHYRLVKGGRRRLTGLDPADLGVPVGLAFFTLGTDGVVTARYPSPAGSTGHPVEPAAWEKAVGSCPPLAGLRPGVEAVLVNTLRGADERWLVPVDDCYRLVAVVRRAWKGLSGGTRVWPEIEAFFASLAEGETCDG
ncbi:DUF5947 family protein [Actinocorallia sp. B10E7]|uniref:DUF5947 family protein n=1 Tax=Actinocorallia sp. B10E7 TaxID=3153558 RepID=UPI00325EFCC3